MYPVRPDRVPPEYLFSADFSKMFSFDQSSNSQWEMCITRSNVIEWD